MPFSDPTVHEFALLDPEGTQVPIQVLTVQRNGDGGIRLAHVASTARDVPSVGYAVYLAVPPSVAMDNDSAAIPLSNSAYQDTGEIENDLYCVSFDLRTGAMTSLILKADHWQALQAPSNVVAREDDRRDPWDLSVVRRGNL